VKATIYNFAGRWNRWQRRRAEFGPSRAELAQASAKATSGRRANYDRRIGVAVHNRSNAIRHRSSWPWLAALFGLVLVALSMGCTAAQIQGWQLAIAALSAAAPSVCTIVYDTAGAQAGKVCGTAAPDVQGLASWLSGVLGTIPVAPAASAKAAPPVVYEAGGLHVELRADLAPAVVARAKAEVAP